ncbi:MAG: hypothetical protein R3F30_04955 [Planctomycetota bacterium]
MAEPRSIEAVRDPLTDTGAGQRVERNPESGVALIVAMFFVILTAGIVFVGTVEQDRQKKSIDLNLYWRSHAQHFAEAGLVEGADWFRRQSKQPVVAFDPKLDLLATPPIMDTSDPAIGIVREYEIGRSVWGRFEVRREVPGLAGTPEVMDITKHRGLSGNGAIWRLVCRSFVYRRRDPGKAYDQAPNIPLATKILECEIRRMSFAPPALGAVVASRGQYVTVSNFGRIDGGIAAGVAYPSGTGKPTGSTKKSIEGNPPQSAQATWYDDPEQVFGVSEDELRSMADLVINDPYGLPNPLPTNKLVFVDGDCYATTTNPLKGTCFLYVKGDLRVYPNTYSSFSGFLYVGGDCYLEAPVDVTGMAMLKGNANLIGTGDWATITYDGDIIDSLLLEIGQYRRSTAVFDHDLRQSVKD